MYSTIILIPTRIHCISFNDVFLGLNLWSCLMVLLLCTCRHRRHSGGDIFKKSMFSHFTLVRFVCKGHLVKIKRQERTKLYILRPRSVFILVNNVHLVTFLNLLFEMEISLHFLSLSIFPYESYLFRV